MPFYVDGVAKALGFSEYYGMEDMPRLLDYPSKEARFGWDHETYQFTLSRLDRAGGPFLAVVFTGTIHTPYSDPGERFHLRPHVEKGEDGYVNTLHYSDWAFGEFLREARTRPWYGNTVFVFCADHPWRTSSSADLRDSFRIPCILFGKGIAPAVNDVVASQVDILPTMMEVLGFPDAFSSLGESLLSKKDGEALREEGRRRGADREGRLRPVEPAGAGLSQGGFGAAPARGVLLRRPRAPPPRGLPRHGHFVAVNRWGE